MSDKLSDIEFWAYTSGFFDGEGCLSVEINVWFCRSNRLDQRKTSKGLQIRAEIGQNDRGVLSWLRRGLIKRSFLVGPVKSSWIKKKAKCNRITLYGKENIKRFLKKILPYSQVKRAQIYYFLDTLLPTYQTLKQHDGLRLYRRNGIRHPHFKQHRLNQMKIIRMVAVFRSLKKSENAVTKYTPNFWRKQMGLKMKKGE